MPFSLPWLSAALVLAAVAAGIAVAHAVDDILGGWDFGDDDE